MVAGPRRDLEASVWRGGGWKSAVTVLATSICSACGQGDPDAAPAPDGTELMPQPADVVEVNGVSLAYQSFGASERETVLLIAGAGMQAVEWPMALVEELVERGYRVIRFDSRDVGRSTIHSEAGLPDSMAIRRALEEGRPAPLPYDFHDLAADAVGLLDALEIPAAHIVGISMGGAIAQLIAIDRPDRTLSLTLLMSDSGNPALPIPRPEAFVGLPIQPTSEGEDAFVEWQVATWRALAGSAYPEDEEMLRNRARRVFARGFDPDALTRHQTVSLVGHLETAEHRRENLEQIEVPTVVLHGAEDPLVDVAAARELADRIPNADLRIIDGLGHELPLQLASVFADAITDAADAVPPHPGPLATTATLPPPRALPRS